MLTDIYGGFKVAAEDDDWGAGMPSSIHVGWHDLNTGAGLRRLHRLLRLADHPTSRKYKNSPAPPAATARKQAAASMKPAPPVCRSYFCAWRTVDIFSEAWRPDKSGVLPYIETEGIAENFDLSTGIGLMLVGNPLKIVRQKWFQDFIVTGVMSSRSCSCRCRVRAATRRRRFR